MDKENSNFCETIIGNKKQISDLTEEEMMEFIECLNESMQQYDHDIEFRMEQSENREWSELEKHHLSNEQQKRIYLMKKIRSKNILEEQGPVKKLVPNNNQ